MNDNNQPKIESEPQNAPFKGMPRGNAGFRFIPLLIPIVVLILGLVLLSNGAKLVGGLVIVIAILRFMMIYYRISSGRSMLAQRQRNRQ